MAVAHLPKIVGHAGEVAVAAIEEIGGKSRIGHATSQTWKTAATVGMTHDADIGESRISADDAHQPTVGTEGIGIALLEVHRLQAKAVETGSDVVPLSAEIADEGAATAFHDDEHNLTAPGKKEGVGRGNDGLRIVTHPRKDSRRLGIGHESVGTDAAGAVGHRGEERKQRIHRRMVEDLARTVVDRSDTDGGIFGRRSP